MNRPLAALALIAALLPAAAGATGPAATAAVRKVATVAADVVRLGDLLENAGAAASAAVFHAPGLGATGTVQVHRVVEAAREQGITELDTRGLSEVLVVRAARTVTVAELERAVVDAALRQLGLADTRDVAIRFDREVRPIPIEPEIKEPARVIQFAYDPHAQRFAGVLEVPGSVVLRRQPVRLSGTLQETAEVVTSARALNRGETVRESDVIVERRPRAELANDALARPEQVIGQAVRRALRAGQPVRPVDLMKPDLVARNDLVTIKFEAPGLTLTARGKALAAGAEGEVIAVQNPHSKRVLQATVLAPGLVGVGRTQPVVAEAGVK